MSKLNTSLCYTDKENIIFGNNRILCFGLCITGEDLWSRIAAIIALLCPCLYFNFTTLIWYYSNYGMFIPITVLFLELLLLVSYTLVSISDPGILPRHDSSKTFHDSLTNSKSKGVVPYIEIPINGVFLRIKYCTTCNIYRNPRTIHCSSCDTCVDRFDHHCKWLGNCIGSRNYGIFYLSITVMFILAFFMQVLCCYTIAIISIYGSEGDRVDMVQAAICLTYLLLTTWFILGLVVYHTYLILTNQTTNEQLKGVYGDFNPWDKGVLFNIYDVLFRKKKSRHYYHPLIKNKIYCQNFQEIDQPTSCEDLEAQIVDKNHKIDSINSGKNALVKDSEINKKLQVYGNMNYQRSRMEDSGLENCRDASRRENCGVNASRMDDFREENSRNTFTEAGNAGYSNLTKISSEEMKDSANSNYQYSEESSMDCEVVNNGSMEDNFRYNPLYDLTKLNKYSRCSLKSGNSNKYNDNQDISRESDDRFGGYTFNKDNFVSDKFKGDKSICLNSTVVARDIRELCDAIE